MNLLNTLNTYMSNNKDNWEKELDKRWYLMKYEKTTNIDWATSCNEEIKSFIESLLSTQRQEIKDKIENKRGKWDRDGLMANRGELWNDLIDDILSDL